jgi:hypothetical protein
MSHSGLDLAVLVLSTARMSRFVTTDALGDWWVRKPVADWAEQEDEGHREKVVTLVNCPYCIGQWLALGNLAAYALTRNHPVARSAWRYLAGGMALNYVVAHVSSRLDV